MYSLRVWLTGAAAFAASAAFALMVAACGGSSSIEACENNHDCDGHTAGEFCDVDTGRCVECLTHSDCIDHPNGEFCDPDSRTCIGAGCGDSSECVGDPNGEVCDTETGQCVECLVETDCTGDDVCQPSRKECVECVGNGDCAGNPAGPICGPLNTCQPGDGCTDSGDCTADPDRPHCDTVSGQCVECLNRDHCAGNPNGEICNPVTLTCGQEVENCTGNTDCMDNAVRVICDTNAGVCVECLDENDCDTDPYTICNNITGLCVECIHDNDCTGNPTGEVCHSVTGRCVECEDNTDCASNPNGNFCDPATDTCVNCVPSDCLTEILVCGTHDDGCGGTLDCQTCGVVGNCISNGADCDCPGDTDEPNDNHGGAVDLGTFTDDPDTAATRSDLSIHTDADEDWYVMTVQNTGFLGNPIVDIELYLYSPFSPSAWNLGSDSSGYELTVWYLCSAGGDAPTCGGWSSSEPDTTYGYGCTHLSNYTLYPWVVINTDCNTTDDSGVAVIRVRKLYRYGRCDTYELDMLIH